jgi:hypothetical protein
MCGWNGGHTHCYLKAWGRWEGFCPNSYEGFQVVTSTLYAPRAFVPPVSKEKEESVSPSEHQTPPSWLRLVTSFSLGTLNPGGEGTLKEI